MKSGNRFFLSSTYWCSWAFVALVLGSTMALSQSKLEPPPENIKIVGQVNSPLSLAMNEMRVDPKYGQALSYSVKNVGTVGVRGFVVAGMPGTTQRAVPLEMALAPGATRSFPIFLYPEKEVKGEFYPSLDFVLLADGHTWGPNATGESDYVTGFFEGAGRFIADARKVLTTGDEETLRKFVNSAPNLPELAGVATLTKKQEGLAHGYGTGLISLRESQRGRGDLNGIPGRIADMDRTFGLAPTLDAKFKRISLSRGIFEPPIKIVEISADNNRVSLDKDFASSSDWLKDFKLTIRNSSGKTIKYITFNLDFPETSASGNVMAYQLSYGPPMLAGFENIRQHETPIGPDATFELNLDDTRFAELKRFLAKRQSLDTLTRLNIMILAIYFDDKTGWSAGQFTKQDPENPNRYIPVDGH